MKSGVPIVPLTMVPSRYIVWPSWDCKKLPLLFGHIRVTVHRPIAVSGGDFEQATRLIVEALGDLEAAAA